METIPEEKLNGILELLDYTKTMPELTFEYVDQVEICLANYEENLVELKPLGELKKPKVEKKIKINDKENDDFEEILLETEFELEELENKFEELIKGSDYEKENQEWSGNKNPEIDNTPVDCCMGIKGLKENDREEFLTQKLRSDDGNTNANPKVNTNANAKVNTNANTKVNWQELKKSKFKKSNWKYDKKKMENESDQMYFEECGHYLSEH